MSTPDPAKEQRIVESRLKLMARWKEEMARTPAVADAQPQGRGPLNRHGMPQLPVGQTETVKWPVLDLGFKPTIALDDWTLSIVGLVERPAVLTWREFLAHAQTDDSSDFHCVTGWSRMNLRWRGWRLVDLAAWVGVKVEARYLLCHGYDGYTVNVPLSEAFKPDVLLVHMVDGQPLPADHGGPVRMITPQLYAWKGAKWIKHLEFLRDDRLGYWEERGYSNTAHPWRDDRYA